MQHEEFVTALRVSASELAGAVRSAPGLAITVPSCPEWSLLQLVGHLGNHHRWVGRNLDRTPADGMAGFDGPPEISTPAELAAWLDDGAETLACKLETAGPDTPCWTWTDDHRTGFWARRTAQETVMHAWDGLHALGMETSIDPELAADGIDEYLAVIALGAWGPTPSTASGDEVHIAVCTTDVAGEWDVRADVGGTTVARERHRNPDVVVSGPASDLLLVLMGRAATNTAAIAGDAAVFERWHDQAHF